MTDSRGSSDRALSSVLGVAVLFGIVLVVSVAMVVASTSALQEGHRSTSMERAEMAMSEFDESIGTLDPASPHARVTAFSGLSADEGNVTVTDEGSIEVTVSDATSGATILDESRSLGAVEYRRESRRIAYQGGGVFRSSADGSNASVVSPPNFDYRYENGKPTLSLPVVSIAGGASGEVDPGQVRLRQTDGPETVFPSGAGATNPLGDSVTVNVTVSSEYYRAWGEVFRQRTDGYVVWDHPNESVTMVLVGEGHQPGRADPDVAASVVTGASTTVTNGGRIDSYDSANGGYPGWRHRANADIVVDDDFKLSEKPDISGDVFVTGQIRIINDPIIYGKTVTGGTPGDPTTDQVPNDAEFKDVVSTTDDLTIDDSSGATFRDALIVGGSIQQFGPARVEGTIHAGRDALLHTGGRSSVLTGDVIAGRDVTVDADVDFDGTDQTIVADEDVTIHGGTHAVDVVAGGDVTVASSATIQGDVDAGGRADIDGVVTGDVHADGPIDDGLGPLPPGWEEHDSPTPPPMDRLRSPLPVDVSVPDSMNDEIADNRSRLVAPSDNDNDTAPIDDVEASGGCSPGCTVDAGEYFVDGSMTVTDTEHLEFDTSDGDVNVFVDGRVHVKGEVTVTGDNTVRIYTEDNLVVEKGDASVTTPDDDASQLWVYLRDDAAAKFRSDDPTFTGIVFGPGSSGTDGADIRLNNQATVYGSLVGRIDTFNSDASLHYDENLDYVSQSDSSYVDDSGRVVYLQFTSRTVTVED